MRKENVYTSPDTQNEMIKLMGRQIFGVPHFLPSWQTKHLTPQTESKSRYSIVRLQKTKTSMKNSLDYIYIFVDSIDAATSTADNYPGPLSETECKFMKDSMETT